MSYDPRNFECDRFPGPPYEPEDQDGLSPEQLDGVMAALVYLRQDLGTAIGDFAAMCQSEARWQLTDTRTPATELPRSERAAGGYNELDLYLDLCRLQQYAGLLWSNALTLRDHGMGR